VTVHRARLTLRTRLTLTFSAVFLLAGGALIAVTAVIARHSIDRAASNEPALAALKSAINRAVGPTSAGPSKSPSPEPGQVVTTIVNGTKTAVKIPAGGLGEAQKSQILDANNAYTAATRSDAVRHIVTGSVIAAALLIPAAALLGWLLARRALRPVRAITGAAHRVSANQLSERLAIDGPRDEITELATTFDAMMDRLEHAFDAQRRFVANASHELRTPLAVAGTAVDVVLAKPDRRPEQLEAMASDVRTAVGQAERVVESLLALTRSQHLDHRRDAVDLAALAEDALDARAAQIAERGLTVSTQLADAATTGDRSLLERLVGNLVDNAIRHNVHGGQIDVRSGFADGCAELEVANSGAVIPPDRVAALLEPFQRLDGRARNGDSGLGLGLAIVQAVADAHEATLDLQAQPAGGLRVLFRLPAPRTG
jgi:signal transduction histidine kinase